MKASISDGGVAPPAGVGTGGGGGVPVAATGGGVPGGGVGGFPEVDPVLPWAAGF